MTESSPPPGGFREESVLDGMRRRLLQAKDDLAEAIRDNHSPIVIAELREEVKVRTAQVTAREKLEKGNL
jgi:hypothetical protein